jgi:glucosamine--fructose-6-phosphate aminotransferase (isomerizing)
MHAAGRVRGRRNEARPHALIDQSMPVVVLTPRDSHYEKTPRTSRSTSPKASDRHSDRGGPRNERRAARRPDSEGDDNATPPSPSSLQILAYYRRILGTDVDQPRNPAKTVVE